MEQKIYPGSTPEFRIFEKLNGISEIQIRYINEAQGYTGKWMPIKIEKEKDESNGVTP